MLKAHHKVARLEYAKNHMHWTDEWKRVIFSDEKKFNLDGPDGYSSYWHDLRQKKNDPKLSRNFHGGSVMIWGAFSSYGKLKLCFINGKINSERYVDMLDGALIPFFEDTVGEREFIFQQDNAAIHVSKYSREWFKTRDIPLIEWPACSPDMNPIENLWGIMARNIQQESRHFSKRNFGGGSVMIRAAFSAFGKTTLAFIDTRMDSRQYQKVLEEHLLPYFRRFPSANLRFMHDNATVHVSASTRQWLQEKKKINTIAWPARSPDLNPIENLWGQLVRDVYDNCRQYNTVSELKTAILEAWNRVTPEQFGSLSASMTRRINLLIKSGGKSINY
ncbi:Transposable element Tc3 transposase [Anthophora plagiata]